MSTEKEKDSDYHKRRNQCQHQNWDSMHRNPCICLVDYEMCDSLEHGRIITIYYQQHDRVNELLRRKYPALVNRKGDILQHVNACE